MRIPHSSTMQRDFSVSMTPMIDVVFLLLIFFVCTASFQISEFVLPSPLALDGSTAEVEAVLAEPDLERIVVGVSRSEGELRLTVNGRVCQSLARLSELLESLHKIDANLPVLLDVDDEALLGSAIDVYDRCRLAKFQRIQFVAEVP